MAKNIDGIVKCDISISSPAVSSESFSGLLLVGPPPADETEVDPVAVYSSFEAVQDAGYKEADPVYTAAMVAFAQSPKPDKVYVASIQKTEPMGETDEEPTETVKRALGTDGWYFILPAGVESTKFDALAAYVETTQKMLGVTYEAKEEDSISTKGLWRSNAWKLADNQTSPYDKYLHVAICAAIAYLAPGTETWSFKSLALITPGEFSDTEIAKMDESCLNYYVCIAKKNITQGGKVLGDEWIDVIRFRDWLKNQIQMNCFNVFVMNPKVAYVDSGIALLHNAVIAALKSGQEVGGIAPDSYDENDNKIPGYTSSAPLAASLSPAQKKSRVLPDIKWSAYLAGAIHCVEVSGTLGY